MYAAAFVPRQLPRRCRHRYYARLSYRFRVPWDLRQDEKEEEGEGLRWGHTLTCPPGGAEVGAHAIGRRALHRRRTAQKMAQTLPDEVDVTTAATIQVVTPIKGGRQQLVRSNCCRYCPKFSVGWPPSSDLTSEEENGHWGTRVPTVTEATASEPPATTTPRPRVAPTATVTSASSLGDFSHGEEPEWRIYRDIVNSVYRYNDSLSRQTSSVDEMFGGDMVLCRPRVDRDERYVSLPPPSRRW